MKGHPLNLCEAFANNRYGRKLEINFVFVKLHSIHSRVGVL